MQVPLLLLAISLGAGLALQHVRAVPDNAHSALNQYIINIALPALALVHIPRITLHAGLLYPVGTAYIIFLSMMPLVVMVARKSGWNRQTTGSVILAACLGNTAFLGYPIIEALYGTEGLQIALLVDQPGSFVVGSTFGIAVAGYYSSRKNGTGDVLRKVATFPPFLVFCLALVMNLTGIRVEGALLEVLKNLGATLTPIALVSIGLQLRFSGIREMLRPLAFGLFCKLVLAPALIYFLYVTATGGKGLLVQVSILQAAMPPMITGAIIASEYGLNARLSTLLAGVGVVVSAVTLTIWYLVVQGAG